MISAVCTGIAAGIFLGELSIKNHIERMELPAEGEKKLFGGRLLIRRHHNRGITLNLGANRRALVAAASAVLTILITAVFILSLGQCGNNLLRAGLSILLGGAFSNTYDRLKRKYVVDYLSFGVPWRWLRRIIFNISDFCILIGALLAALGAAQ